MRRAGRVVADGRQAPDEYRASVPDPREERGSVLHVQLQVLGCVGLRPLDRLVECLDQFDPHVLVPVDERADRGRQVAIVRQEERLAVRAVLCLGEQVGRDPLRARGSVRDHDDLAWARGQVDPNTARRRGSLPP